MTDGNTVYSGELMGKQAAFTVYTDKTVVFQYDDKIYGTYKATEDPTAIPENEDLAQRMRGVELCKDDEILFRGGIMVTEDTCWLFNEDGTSAIKKQNIFSNLYPPLFSYKNTMFYQSVIYYHKGGRNQGKNMVTLLLKRCFDMDFYGKMRPACGHRPG